MPRLRRENAGIISALVLMIAATVLFAFELNKPGFAVLAAGFSAIAFHLLDLPSQIKIEVEKASGQNIDKKFALLEKCTKLGLSMVYSDRKEAINDFWQHHVLEQLQSGEPVVINATSLRGWEENSRHMVNLIQEGFKKGLCFHILLLHPQYSRIRARQEGSERDGERHLIARDIDKTVKDLTGHSIPQQSITFLKGVPTAFVIATRRWLMFQPYPQVCDNLSETMFTLIAERDHSDQIYEQIWRNIINLPTDWDGSSTWVDERFYEKCDSKRDYEEYGRRPITI